MIKQFVTTGQRDEWLNREYPERKATEVPGIYQLANGWMLSVNWLKVTVFRPEPSIPDKVD